MPGMAGPLIHSTFTRISGAMWSLKARTPIQNASIIFNMAGIINGQDGPVKEKVPIDKDFPPCDHWA